VLEVGDELKVISFVDAGFGIHRDGKSQTGLEITFGTAPDNELTVDALRSLHPKGPPLPRHDLTGINPFPIDSFDVLRAIQSFPKETGCSRSGLRAIHLLNMHGSDDAFFISALTSVISIVSAGKALLKFGPFFASAPLVPTLEKGGGIRPMADGEVLR
jgi:hypothetical protein